MLSVLASPELKEKIITASQASARSLSAEAESRLETGFNAPDLLAQALAVTWAGNAEAVYLVGEIFARVSPKGEWLTDEFARDSVRLAVGHALDALADPEGCPVVTETGGGAMRAQALLWELGDTASPWALAKRARLGAALVQRIDHRARVIDDALAQRQPEPEDQERAHILDQARATQLAETAKVRAQQDLAAWEAGITRRGPRRGKPKT
jgi:hypothetical protein